MRGARKEGAGRHWRFALFGFLFLSNSVSSMRPIGIWMVAVAFHSTCLVSFQIGNHGDGWIHVVSLALMKSIKYLIPGSLAWCGMVRGP